MTGEATPAWHDFSSEEDVPKVGQGIPIAKLTPRGCASSDDDDDMAPKTALRTPWCDLSEEEEQDTTEHCQRSVKSTAASASGEVQCTRLPEAAETDSESVTSESDSNDRVFAEEAESNLAKARQELIAKALAQADAAVRMLPQAFIAAGQAASLPWTEFSGDVGRPLDGNKCMARVWGNGRGGQCQHAPMDLGVSPFCRAHSTKDRWRTHGRIDGPIPGPKLAEFQRHARKVARQKGESSDPNPSDVHDEASAASSLPVELSPSEVPSSLQFSGATPPEPPPHAGSASASSAAPADGDKKVASGSAEQPIILKRRKRDRANSILPPTLTNDPDIGALVERTEEKRAGAGLPQAEGAKPVKRTRSLRLGVMPKAV